MFDHLTSNTNCICVKLNYSPSLSWCGFPLLLY